MEQYELDINDVKGLDRAIDALTSVLNRLPDPDEVEYADYLEEQFVRNMRQVVLDYYELEL